MSDLAPTPEAAVARIAETDYARRRADAQVDVARRAQLADEELLPLLRERLDAWRDWGEALGEATVGGHRDGHVSGTNVDSAERFAQHKARKLRWDVPEDAYLAYRDREDIDRLTLAGALRLAPAPALDDAPPLPAGEYATVVIDPPWPMQKIERDERPNQTIALDYQPMSEGELADLAIPAADDCHLYLWTTHKFLPLALELAAGWGFNYQCVLTWVKNVGFTPFSWMYSTELCLFCRRGSLDLLVKGRRLDFDGKVREHSRKPDEFYALVRDVSPGPRIDMFAREAHDGFEAWGAETARFTDAA